MNIKKVVLIFLAIIVGFVTGFSVVGFAFGMTYDPMIDHGENLTFYANLAVFSGLAFSGLFASWANESIQSSASLKTEEEK